MNGKFDLPNTLCVSKVKAYFTIIEPSTDAETLKYKLTHIFLIFFLLLLFPSMFWYWVSKDHIDGFIAYSAIFINTVTITQ